MIIFGAGMAGLLAGNMLRRHSPVIHERQDSLPNNHAALLRFRTDSVSKLTGIPFRKVRVDKAIYYKNQHLKEATIALSNMYSYKVLGRVIPRSIGNLESADRWIAPPDFIAQMAKTCKIEYGSDMRDVMASNNDHQIISTIPLPVLITHVKTGIVTDLPFTSKAIASVWTTIPNCDVYQTIYYPDRELPYYRASITGDRLIIEFDATGVSELYIKHALHETAECCLQDIFDSFGIEDYTHGEINVKYQKYGKINPLDQSVRQEILRHITDQTGIYSLGRFACWRQVLLDDVVDDVIRIEKWMTSGNAYQRALHYS